MALAAFETLNAAITSVGKVLDYFKTNIKAHVDDNAMTKLTKLARAEPLTIISQDCANLEYMPALLNNLCSIYAGYFAQAVSIMTSAVTNIEIIKTLDALNPNRDSTGWLLQSRNTTLSAMEPEVDVALLKHNLLAQENVAKSSEAKSSDNLKVIYEHDSLAVGKLIHVSFQVPVRQKSTVDGEMMDTCELTNVTLPIMVRLAPAILADDTISHIFLHKKDSSDIIERYYSWRAGRISFIKDMVFCQDLIREYRKASIKDKTGTLQEIVRRVNANRGYGLLTKNPSMAISSNLYVLSAIGAKEIEAKTGLRLKDAKSREKIFDGTYAMIIAVVDTEWEQVTLYFNGISSYSTISVRALKGNSKKGDVDIADLMKTLLEGRAPTF